MRPRLPFAFASRGAPTRLRHVARQRAHHRLCRLPLPPALLLPAVPRIRAAAAPLAHAIPTPACICHSVKLRRDAPPAASARGHFLWPTILPRDAFMTCHSPPFDGLPAT